jgi:hypothetical protein
VKPADAGLTTGRLPAEFKDVVLLLILAVSVAVLLQEEEQLEVLPDGPAPRLAAVRLAAAGQPPEVT